MFAFDNVNGALAHAVEFGATIALNEDGATCVTAWCFDPDGNRGKTSTHVMSRHFASTTPGF